MLLSTMSEVIWNARNKNHYTGLGYEFSNMGKSFSVKVSDLTSGSRAIVSVKCDYCGSIYQEKYYAYHNACKDTVNVDCCNKCKKDKIKDTLLIKHGVDKPSMVDGASKKAMLTNLKRYGVENVFASDEIKMKIYRTNIEKYGDIYPNKNQEVSDRKRETIIKKYGVSHFMKLPKYRELFSGENSPVWKTEKTFESREHDRSLPEYKEWRNSVFQRDHYKCCACGGRGRKNGGLQAHHVLNWNDYKNSRYDIDNGLTLCVSCHMQFHSIYGKKNNTISQITEFISHGKKIC